MIKLTLTDQNQKEFETVMCEEMDKITKHFERELITIRTGRAHPSLVESIKVPCYGGTTMMELKQVAAISAPDIRLIMIEPWDKAIINDIEKALTTSNLGITPENDGNVIRIRLPEMSAERRDELAKVLNKKLEESKISSRNIRKDFNNLIKDTLKEKTISEDHSRRLMDLLQKVTEKYCKLFDDMAAKKEQQLRLV